MNPWISYNEDVLCNDSNGNSTESYLQSNGQLLCQVMSLDSGIIFGKTWILGFEASRIYSTVYACLCHVYFLNDNLVEIFGPPVISRGSLWPIWQGTFAELSCHWQGMTPAGSWFYHLHVVAEHSCSKKLWERCGLFSNWVNIFK